MRSDADEEGGIMTFENSLPFPYVRPSTTRTVHATLKRKHGARVRADVFVFVRRAYRDVVHAGVFDARTQGV